MLVQTYLALLKGKGIEGKEDRQIILQALFRNASDGLVKDDSLPSIAHDLATRLK